MSEKEEWKEKAYHFFDLHSTVSRSRLEPIRTWSSKSLYIPKLLFGDRRCFWRSQHTIRCKLTLLPFLFIAISFRFNILFFLPFFCRFFFGKIFFWFIEEYGYTFQAVLYFLHGKISIISKLVVQFSPQSFYYLSMYFHACDFSCCMDWIFSYYWLLCKKQILAAYALSSNK